MKNEQSLNQSAEALSFAIENLLVSRNLRGMKSVQPALAPGYVLRAAKMMQACRGVVLIGTGFPVVDTFETDGPVGAVSLYRALEALGAKPIIVCGAPLSDALKGDYQVHELLVGEHDAQEQEASDALAKYQPELIISIERPGQSADGGYYNMRGESISPRSACFDTFMRQSDCPTIAIGDGGNEIGMGNIGEALRDLDIVPAATTCDELIVADVSNWGGHGLVAMLSFLQGEDLLASFNLLACLEYFSARGSVDGVTRENTLTEDGLPLSEGELLLLNLRELAGFSA